MTKKMTEKRFNNLLNQRSILNAKIEKLKAKVEDRESQIKALFTDGIETIETDLYKVIYAEIVSMRFNTDLFKKENTGVYEKYRNKKVISKPFHVYPIKK